MPVDPLAVGLSGIHAAATRHAASAHNVANLTTPDFRPLRTVQTGAPGGGARAALLRAPAPEHVDLAHEAVEQIRARVQLEASARVVGASSRMLGRLVDLFA